MATFSQLEATLSYERIHVIVMTRDYKSASTFTLGKEVVFTDKVVLPDTTVARIDYVTYEIAKDSVSINEKKCTTTRVSILYQRMSTTMRL